MNFKSIYYTFPSLYELMLKYVHGKFLPIRYKFISKEIGKNKRVLDAGCGTCLLASFLDRSNKYFGIDLNERFLNYAIKKKRAANITKTGIFNFSEYPKADVIVVCDVLHHIYPKHEFFLKEILKRSEKIIFVEPIGKSMNNFLTFLVDADGINSINADSGPTGWKKKFENEKHVIEFFKKFNPEKIKVLNKDVIAVFNNKVRFSKNF